MATAQGRPLAAWTCAICSCYNDAAARRCCACDTAHPELQSAASDWPISDRGARPDTAGSAPGELAGAAVRRIFPQHSGASSASAAAPRPPQQQQLHPSRDAVAQPVYRPQGSLHMHLVPQRPTPASGVPATARRSPLTVTALSGLPGLAPWSSGTIMRSPSKPDGPPRHSASVDPRQPPGGAEPFPHPGFGDRPRPSDRVGSAPPAALAPHETFRPASRAPPLPPGIPELDPQAAQTWVYPTNMAVREYQFNIVSQALFQVGQAVAAHAGRAPHRPPSRLHRRRRTRWSRCPRAWARR